MKKLLRTIKIKKFKIKRLKNKMEKTFKKDFIEYLKTNRDSNINTFWRYNYLDYDSGTFNKVLENSCITFLCQGNIENAIYNLSLINEDFLLNYSYFTELSYDKDEMFVNVCKYYIADTLWDNGFIELKISK